MPIDPRTVQWDAIDPSAVQWDEPARPTFGKPQPLSFLERIMGAIPSGVVNNPTMTGIRGAVTGMADPTVGLAQFGANMLPDSTGIPQQVNQAIASKDRDYQAERQAYGSKPPPGYVLGKSEPGVLDFVNQSLTGADMPRAAGNILSPVNLAVAAKLPMAVSAVGRATQGSAIGAAGGASMPVEDTSKQGYWEQKGKQIGGGAVVGGVSTPLFGGLVDAVARRMNGVRATPANAAIEADKAISDALADINAKMSDIPRVDLDALRAQVAASLKSGTQLDAASLLRKADFEKLGMGDLATAGQISRDPMQWSQEFNMRQVKGAGEPILSRVQAQTKMLADLVRSYGGPEAKQASEAGRIISGPLAEIDKASNARADVLYKGFRELAPDVAVKDPARFSNTLLEKLDDAQVQSNLSKDWVDRLNKITTGEFPLTPATLEQMYRNAGDKLRGAQGSEKKAYSLVKTAIDDEMKLMAASFPRGSDAALAKESLDLGRKTVRERYGLREALPAIEAAADGTTSSDVFVKQFVLNAPTDQVKQMAALLRKESPEAFQEARNQIGAQLQLKAFGENPSGGGDFLPAGFKKQVGLFGDEKLSIFFSAAEIDQMKTAARVGAYINSTPAGAVPNRSGSGAAVANLLRRGAGAAADMVPYVGRPAAALAGVVGDRMGQDSIVKAAINNTVPTKDVAGLTPAQRKIISEWLSGGAVTAGMFSGSQ